MPRVKPDLKRPTCEASPSLDIRHLHREGLLYPGSTFVCTWTSPHGQPLARVDVTVSGEELLLEWKSTSQRILITWTVLPLSPNCRGTRPWFLCPQPTANGEPCGRRCEVLYRSDDSPYFACRICGHLAYACQSESDSARSVRRAGKARLRLARAVHAAAEVVGGRVNLFDPLPVRPPWKCRRVYARLLSAAQHATEACWGLQQPDRPVQGRDAIGRYFPLPEGVIRYRMPASRRRN